MSFNTTHVEGANKSCSPKVHGSKDKSQAGEGGNPMHCHES
jgi:hypothetical protein